MAEIDSYLGDTKHEGHSIAHTDAQTYTWGCLGMCSAARNNVLLGKTFVLKLTQLEQINLISSEIHNN